MALLLVPATPGLAQKASDEQNRVVDEVAQCLLAGLPPDWAVAEMRVELQKPGADTGNASYVMRRKLSGGQFESFRPCDEKKAARALLDIRKSQSKERRNWTGARLVLRQEGSYDLTFDYAKPAPKPGAK
jgi:hypothetical protein